MEEVGKETPKQSGLVIKVYGMEIARDKHFASTKNVCTTKNTRMKNEFCKICGAKSTSKFCPARKYEAYTRSKAHIFHVRSYTCKTKSRCPKPSTTAKSVVVVDPTTPSSCI